jgi:competence protein ComEC
MRPLVVLGIVALAGCPRTGPVGPVPEPVDAGADAIEAPDAGLDAGPPAVVPRLTWKHVDAPSDVPATPPAAQSWRIHMIDVGTGLSILVEGADFTLLYDAGTNDRDETPMRVIAYLDAALGASGDGQCSERGTKAPRRRIDYLILSHPHLDHASALELVLHCFAIGQIWDSGRVNDTVFYREFVRAVSEAIGTRYHTAAPPPKDRTIVVKGEAIVIPAGVAWDSFSEGDEVPLGAAAHLTLLHAEAKHHPDPNQNSIVVAVDLGATRLLLTGDAESGPREDPSAPVGDVEEHLLDHFAKLIDADILQVGHHGSKTSSRAAFIAAVSPRLALISAGPKQYGSVVLPDQAIIDELDAAHVTILRTDRHDAACPAKARLGPPNGPGGCDSWIVTVDQRPQ